MDTFDYNLICIAVVVTALACYIYNKRLPFYKLSRQYPGPRTLPLIGIYLHFIGRKPEYILKKLMQWADKYGKTYSIWFGPNLHLVLHDLRDIEAVLSSTNLIDKSDEYKFFRNWLRDCLILCSGRKWFQRRKLLTPAFHFNILEQVVPITEKYSTILIQKMHEKAMAVKSAGKAGADLNELLCMCSLDIICESAMGVSINAQLNVNSKYVQAVSITSGTIIKRMHDLLLHFDSIYRFTKTAQLEKESLAIIHNFTEPVIIKRREELLKMQQQQQEKPQLTVGEMDDNANIASAKTPKPFLDILLESTIDGKPLSNSDIYEEVELFMVAGYQTVVTAMLFFLYNMAKNLECQQRCYDEIRQVIGSDKTQPITREHLNKLHYLGLCIKESLRLYPSIPIFSRKVKQNCVINNKHIPAGATVGFSPLYLGRNETLFAEAHLFKPERFEGDIKPYSYIPFSAGPRNCIGQKYAVLEVKGIAANILRNFQVEYAGDFSKEPELICEINLSTKDPLLFKLNVRP